MQISLLLMQQIAQLFLILLMGYAVVKTGLLKACACMGPEQYQLYNDKGAGVDNIFLPQQGLHDGNDQI